MTFIEQTPEDAASPATREYFDSQRAAWGFLPNYVQCFAGRPDVASAWGALGVTIRDGMDRRRFEIATIAAARWFGSTYCTVAHAAFLRDVCGDEDAVRSIAADPTGAGLPEVDAAVFAFATKVAANASSVEQTDVDKLRALGLGDRDVADVVYAVAARAFFTTVIESLGARLDAETAQRFDPDLLAAMVVGRPPAEG